MPTRILRPGRRKWSGILALSLLFVVAGCFMISKSQWTGWFALLFFGLCALTALIMHFPNSAYLRLDKKGFTICSLFRTHSYRWSDIECFDLASVGGRRMVVFNFSGTYPNAQAGHRISAAVSGYESGLPDSYGMAHSELVALLESYRKAA